MNRIDDTLARLKHAQRSGLVCYFTAGDPDFDTCLALLKKLAPAGADMIELGLPFSDPVADGPTIQAAHGRALKAGQTVARTFALVEALRTQDAITPVALMGYLNPIMQYGAARFMQDAANAGVDGLIVVDLPVEHAAPYQKAAREHGLHLIRMTAPTTDGNRLSALLAEADGFIYHVTLTGITGSARPAAKAAQAAQAIARLKKASPVPVAAGFGIRTAADIQMLAEEAALVVVGSCLVESLAAQGVDKTLEAVNTLAAAL